MGLFSKKSEGGLMDVIRCDEQEYLVWKWRPNWRIKRQKELLRISGGQPKTIWLFKLKQMK
jgi:hypothetical protein